MQLETRLLGSSGKKKEIAGMQRASVPFFTPEKFHELCFFEGFFFFLLASWEKIDEKGWIEV